MKRPSGLWILLSAGVLWLSVQDVYGVRATSLIFGKSTTTTTTTTTPSPPKEEEESATTEVNSEGNVTKPTLTGNPQIDYIWDPNLPKELNGYTLGDYPFYERVPEDIDFKCDGLHDGFYASVKHKCQVYHHCLFGRRFDFLCANYTAFDQTLFNCNFVSNVDCVNSKKFWNRNDELYQTKSTTAAPVIYNFYTTAPPSSALTPLPARGTPGRFAYLPAEAPVEQRRPIEQRRAQPQPPLKRVKPFEYYDEEEYEERPRMPYRGKRPRPRPIYYDDYDYYEEGYPRRGAGRRRRPYERRPARKNQGRRIQHDYEDDDDDDDYGLEEDSVRTQRGNRKSSNRRDALDKKRTKPSKKRPIDDEYEDDYEETSNSKSPKHEESVRAKAEPKRSQKMSMRRYLPASLEYDEDLDSEEPSRVTKNSKRNSPRKQTEDSRAIIKPTTGTIYDRPRMAPRINLPVPKNAADKFTYKSVSNESPVAASEEYYNDYESGENHSKEESSSERTTSTSTTERTPEKPARRRPVSPRRKNNPDRTTEKEPLIGDYDRNDDEEIQERRADRKQAPVIVKSPLLAEEKEAAPTPKPRTKSMKSRVSVFKTRVNPPRHHNDEGDILETVKISDILEGNYDESINEAY